MPHLHDCKVIADFVEQGRSEVEWVYLRGGRKGRGREEEEGMEEWRKEQTKKKRRQYVGERGEEGKSGEERRKEGGKRTAMSHTILQYQGNIWNRASAHTI